MYNARYKTIKVHTHAQFAHRKFIVVVVGDDVVVV